MTCKNCGYSGFHSERREDQPMMLMALVSGLLSLVSPMHQVGLFNSLHEVWVCDHCGEERGALHKGWTWGCGFIVFAIVATGLLWLAIVIVNMIRRP